MFTLKQGMLERYIHFKRLMLINAMLMVSLALALSPLMAHVNADQRALVLHDPMNPVGDPASKVRAAPTRPVSPDILAFEPGKVGQCVHFKIGKAGIKYPMRLIPFDEGTIEFDLWFDQSPGKLEHTCRIMIYYAGKKYPQNLFSLFFGGAKNSGGGKGWGQIFGIDVRDGQGKPTRILTNTKNWPQKQWRHIAMTWKLNAPKQSSLALYIDNKLVGHKSDLTIMQDRQAMIDAQKDSNMGYLWLNPLGNEGDFRIDEFKVYNFQRRFASPVDP